MNLPKYVDMQALTNADLVSNVDQQNEGAAIEAIVIAANDGASIATVTYTAGATKSSLEDLINRLRHEGYTVVPGSTTMTVSWTAYFANPIA